MMSHDVAVIGAGELITAASEAAVCVGVSMKEAVSALVIMTETYSEKLHKEIESFRDFVRSLRNDERFYFPEIREKHNNAFRTKAPVNIVRPRFYIRVMFSRSGYLPWRIRRKRKGR